jgi:hypothetical protein
MRPSDSIICMRVPTYFTKTLTRNHSGVSARGNTRHYWRSSALFLCVCPATTAKLTRPWHRNKTFAEEYEEQSRRKRGTFPSDRDKDQRHVDPVRARGECSLSGLAVVCLFCLCLSQGVPFSLASDIWARICIKSVIAGAFPSNSSILCILMCRW